MFTEEDTENLPQLNKQYQSLSILNVSAIGVEKLLLNLNASKAAGPDKLRRDKQGRDKQEEIRAVACIKIE